MMPAVLRVPESWRGGGRQGSLGPSGPSPAPAEHQSRVPGTVPRWLWELSKEGDSTTSPGNLCFLCLPEQTSGSSFQRPHRTCSFLCFTLSKRSHWPLCNAWRVVLGLSFLFDLAGITRIMLYQKSIVFCGS